MIDFSAGIVRRPASQACAPLRRAIFNPRLILLCLFASAVASVPGSPAQESGVDRALPRDSAIGQMELVATFDGPMPTGVTVSHAGRIFVNFPRWGDKVDFTVAELKNGKAVPYPDAAVNRPDKVRPAERLLSVQSVVVDPKDRLWILDTGSVEFVATTYGGPKLVGVDLQQDRIFHKILLP
jgi:hypothetical protein